jgi:tryptophan synthase alpha chain
MSRISQIFKNNKKALIVFIMAGDPSLDKTEKLVYEIEKAGADIIELGIPFSDSIADGPTIQGAATRALAKGVSAADVIKLAKKIRKRSQIPLIFMTSFNILYSYGLEKFVKDSAAAGIDGLILPDLPVDEADSIKKNGLDLIFLVAPNSSDDHIKLAAKKSSGFIYVVSITGITGARKELALDISDVISKIREQTKTPIAIGFGISTPAQAKEASKLANGIIVGSAVIDVISKKPNQVGKFVASLKRSLEPATKRRGSN